MADDRKPAEPEPTEEDQKRFTDTVKRLLNTPHKPHKPESEKTAPHGRRRSAE